MTQGRRLEGSDRSIWSTEPGNTEETMQYNYIPAEEAGSLAVDLMNENHTGVRIDKVYSEEELRKKGYLPDEGDA